MHRNPREGSENNLDQNFVRKVRGGELGALGVVFPKLAVETNCVRYYWYSRVCLVFLYSRWTEAGREGC